MDIDNPEQTNNIKNHSSLEALPQHNNEQESIFTTGNIMSQSPNNSHQDNRTTTAINKILGIPKVTPEILLNHSIHANPNVPSTSTNEKGKNKEYDHIIQMNQGLPPITKKHDFNYISLSELFFSHFLEY
ncbi:hypothetical protein C1645_745497 [Glomus cerebriforme]|uniref:Uncharacterized protein n=1 Tax=Glomus cerebriforme TaxID=658196 RepID=A0A397SCJ0_9GLOM|nr:hypothetical protein C1645_745497 [Glomus cerebriforme]